MGMKIDNMIGVVVALARESLVELAESLCLLESSLGTRNCWLSSSAAASLRDVVLALSALRNTSGSIRASSSSSADDTG